MDVSERPAVSGRVGACEIRLELERLWVPWGGSLEGVLHLAGGDRPQKLSICEVRLSAPVGGSSAALPTGVARWDPFAVPARGMVEFPFSLKMGWGSPGFGKIGMVHSYVVPRTFPWWPSVLTMQLDVTPPREFVRVGSLLAEITGMQLGLWRVVSGGDGAGMTLKSDSAADPLERVDLTLYKSPQRVYGEMAVTPRQGARRRIALRVEDEDPEALRAMLRSGLDPILSGTEHLPIPSAPKVRTDSLPIPSEPAAPSGESLPRPSGGQE